MKKILYLIFFYATLSFASEQLIIEPDAGRTPLLHAIKQAHSSIDLVMYGLTDGRLLNALIAAKERGINVRVMLEPHPYLAANENKKSIRRLKEAGVSYHDSNPNYQLTHQKTLIIDHHNAFIMTFNFTQTPFKNQRNFALDISDAAAINEIENTFTADWNNMTPAYVHPNLLWGPDNSRKKILTMLQQAQTSILMYAPSLSDYQIIGGLGKAAKRGVHVEILMSEENQEKYARKIEYLQRHGVEVRLVKKPQQLHAKVLIIDAKKVMLGSINFTKASLEKNRELSIVSQDPNVVRELTQIFNQDWNDSHNPYKTIYNFLKQKQAKKIERLLVKSFKKMVSSSHKNTAHH